MCTVRFDHSDAFEHDFQVKLMSMSHTLSFDYERRFGGLQRLYGPDVLAGLSGAHIMVAGIGGVGAWCAEALARCGVGTITLIDLDHIAESNVNRQLHALTSTLGQSKVMAMAERILGINPQCTVHLVDDFVSPENVAELFSSSPDVVIDCTDQVPAKTAMILEGQRHRIPVLVCGGAGGKTDPLSLRGGDLSVATHDALLSRLRNLLRRQHGYPRGGQQGGKARRRPPRMGVWSLWFDQPVILPAQWNPPLDTTYSEGLDVRGRVSVDRPASADGLQGLSCAGYGSVVTVTASMGMAAANKALSLVLGARGGI